MLSFNIRDGKTDYTMYVESNTRKNAKIQCTLPVPDTEEIKKILAEIGLEPGEVGIDILTLLRLGKPDQYKKLCKSFKAIAEEQNMFYLGFTNNCVVMLDAKADLEAGNAYLETTNYCNLDCSFCNQGVNLFQKSILHSQIMRVILFTNTFQILNHLFTRKR